MPKYCLNISCRNVHVLLFLLWVLLVNSAHLWRKTSIFFPLILTYPMPLSPNILSACLYSVFKSTSFSNHIQSLFIHSQEAPVLFPTCHLFCHFQTWTSKQAFASVSPRSRLGFRIWEESAQALITSLSGCMRSLGKEVGGNRKEARGWRGRKESSWQRG